MKTAAGQLRDLVFDPKILVMVGVGYALQAKFAENFGIKAVMLGGGTTSADVLGQADSGMLTQTELVENVRRVCDVTTIPIMVDCDTGYGNPENVRRTVASVIKAGAAGFFVEDQVAPKRCGYLVGKEVIPVEEAVDKFRAAIAARDKADPDVVMMARCDARTAVGGSLAELIFRLRAYKATGVDVLMADGLTSWDEVAPIRAAVDGPLYIGPHFMRPPLTLAQLEQAGICMVNFHVESPAYMALWDFYVRMKESGYDGGREYLLGLADHALSSSASFGLDRSDEINDSHVPA